jgi:hypothetical protein
LEMLWKDAPKKCTYFKMVGVLWMVFPRLFKHMHCILHTMPFFKVKLVESKIVSAAHICRSHFLGGRGVLIILLLLFIFCVNLANWFSWYSNDRTKEQLGYTVDSSPRMTYRLLAYCFRVMSSKYSPVYLQSRIDNFIDGVSALLVCFYPTSQFCVSDVLSHIFAPDRKCRL